MTDIAKNLREIRKRIKERCDQHGRDSRSVTLVAVSKFKPSSLIREAYEAGQRTFGENYAQELKEKSNDLNELEINWHFIGHLQKNKAKYVAPTVNLVESVDSVELADTLNKRAPAPIDCLIEVNVGGELSKSGTDENNLVDIARHIESLPNLRLRGLMTIPPYNPDPEKSRPYFLKLNHLLMVLNKELSPATRYSELSMGMSHDFEVAIEEGATIVRVGTAIFGERE
ncbi:MAG: YggS family pyridoxal phosphate-dependent enzyme [Deltaproteobacteria bacterium]|jgi:PLP dependent protein|nr:YggS family pyridoxal phosphate-dependent enzyme [Deltaproteobacteria bacterium]